MSKSDYRTNAITKEDRLNFMFRGLERIKHQMKMQQDRLQEEIKHLHYLMKDVEHQMLAIRIIKGEVEFNGHNVLIDIEFGKSILPAHGVLPIEELSPKTKENLMRLKNTHQIEWAENAFFSYVFDVLNDDKRRSFIIEGLDRNKNRVVYVRRETRSSSAGQTKLYYGKNASKSMQVSHIKDNTVIA